MPCLAVTTPTHEDACCHTQPSILARSSIIAALWALLSWKAPTQSAGDQDLKADCQSFEIYSGAQTAAQLASQSVTHALCPALQTLPFLVRGIQLLSSDFHLRSGLAAHPTPQWALICLSEEQTQSQRGSQLPPHKMLEAAYSCINSVTLRNVHSAGGSHDQAAPS